MHNSHLCVTLKYHVLYEYTLNFSEFQINTNHKHISLNGRGHCNSNLSKSIKFKKTLTQLAMTCSKLAIETLEKGVKYVQS